MPWRPLVVNLLRVLLLFALLYSWQFAVDAGWLKKIFWSRPTDIWVELVGWWRDGTLARASLESLDVFAVGYAAGLLTGLVLGALLGSSRGFARLVEPFVAFVNATPRLILLPLFMVWFGFGIAPRYFLVASVIFIVVAINTAAGIRDVPATLVNDVRMKGGGRAALGLEVYAPSIVLWVLTAARVNVGYALNAAIASEFIGASGGLGYLIVDGQGKFLASQIFAALTVVLVIALVLDTALLAVEQRATRWMPSID
jgi:ABC-type nitrate/sulfonate/bicarbonate transport system permease component